MNRDLGRRGSTDRAPSDRTGPEKITSTSDRSAASFEGDRVRSTLEGVDRKERSTSAERAVSRERPGSAGERRHGSNREHDRSSGQDRERDRPSGSDRDRGRDLGSDRDTDKVSGSGSQKAAVNKDTEGEKSVKIEHKTSTGGGGGGRSVSVDKMTIGEKSAITKKMVDQEKPSIASKEKGNGSERITKSDRFVFFCLSNNVP